jgi:cytochrome c oxidase subunit 2
MAGSSLLNRAAPLLLVLLACAAGTARAASELALALAAKPDAARGEQLYRTCAACHGEDGGGVADGTVPAIGGMPAALVVRQLVNFRHERRSDIRMEHFADATHLPSAQDLADVAAYVGELRRRTPGAIGDGRSLQVGTRAYFRACQACHGALGRASRDGVMPGLAGQHQPYLERQLRDAAAGRRPSMNATHRVALQGLGEDELRGITDYLSRLTP